MISRGNQEQGNEQNRGKVIRGKVIKGEGNGKKGSSGYTAMVD
jgi:hypothetical protein